MIRNRCVQKTRECTPPHALSEGLTAIAATRISVDGGESSAARPVDESMPSCRTRGDVARTSKRENRS
jgi:hypothetical protein